jgi:hypothetical protein
MDLKSFVTLGPDGVIALSAKYHFGQMPVGQIVFGQKTWQMKSFFNYFINFPKFYVLMERRTLKNVSNYFNTNIYSYLETSGG